MKSEVMVSVCVITFNHKDYIRKTLDGILMQNIDFPIEIIIHDDASSDGTADIVREYHNKYPDIIRPILQTENQFQKKIPAFQQHIIPLLRGKYVAHCEGDDYWTDPNKLKKQIDFLECNPDFIAVTHNVEYIDENDEPYQGYQDPSWTKMENREMTLNDAEHRILIGQLATLVYRNLWGNLDSDFMNEYRESTSMNGDQKISLVMLLNGRVWRMSEQMSRYRKSFSNGSYNSRMKGKNLTGRVSDGIYQAISLAKHYGRDLKYDDAFDDNHRKALMLYLKNRTKENRDILKYVYKQHPNKKRVILKSIKYIVSIPFIKLKKGV